MRFLPLFVLAVFGFACSSPEPANVNDATSDPATGTSMPAPGVTPTPAVTGEANVDFTGLAGYPSAVEGCACALSLDAGSEDNGAAYLFVYNFDDGPGVLGINGNEVELDWIKTGATREIPEPDIEEYLHENDKYRVLTRLFDEGPSGDEGRIYSGTVRVEDKATGAWREARVVGDCSC